MISKQSHKILERNLQKRSKQQLIVDIHTLYDIFYSCYFYKGKEMPKVPKSRLAKSNSTSQKRISNKSKVKVATSVPTGKRRYGKSLIRS